LPAGSFTLYDLQTNSETNFDFFLQLGTQLYVKQNSAGPTKGAVYIMMIYGKGQ